MTLGDSFTWAFKDPQWLAKMLVQGLIVLIPIVGWMAMLGWLMMCIDNVRAGKNELPPAGFHLSRGVQMFVVFFLYGLVVAIVTSFFFVLGVIVNGGHGNGPSVTPLFSLGYLVGFAGGLLIRFLTPALLLNTYHRGIAGGLDIPNVWRISTLNVGNAIIAALIIWVASIIGGIGVTLCIIPLIFTVPYENTITAGAVAWFEKEQSAAPTPSTTPA